MFDKKTHGKKPRGSCAPKGIPYIRIIENREGQELLTTIMVNNCRFLRDRHEGVIGDRFCALEGNGDIRELICHLY